MAKLALGNGLVLLSLLRASCCHAMTSYHLHVEGIISTSAVGRTDHKDHDTFPFTLVSNLSMGIMNEVVAIFRLDDSCRTKDVTELTCKYGTKSGTCTAVDINEDRDMDIHMMSRVYSHDAEKLFSAKSEVTLTSSDAVIARETLVRLVPMIRERLGCSSDDFVWTILLQESIMAARKSIDSVTASLERHDRRAASVDEQILGDSDKKNRKRLGFTASKAFKGLDALEVWSYDEVTSRDTVKALFVNGYLSATTAPTGNAHVEALVHPALIAHPAATNVLIVSLTPVAAVKEILKHKSVEHVSVVGLDRDAVKMIQEYLPSLDDCSFLPHEKSPSCMGSSIVTVNDRSMRSWLLDKQHASEAPLFDVVLIDVPIGKDDWLSLELYRELREQTVVGESIVVISSGSAPALFDVQTETELSPREKLMRQVVRDVDHGGIGLGALLVYDEPLAMPLSSTYMVMFQDVTSDCLYRFGRRNAPAIDVDIVRRFRPGIPELLQVYDGPTHLNYMIPSKTWESWYCNTVPGRSLPICETFLSQWYSSEYHSYSTEVRHLPVKGRSLVATQDIRGGAFVNPDDAALGIRIEHDQWVALNAFVERFPDAEMFRQLRDFFLAYGFESESLGRSGWYVSIASNNTFCNHACSNEEETAAPTYEVFLSEDDNKEAAFSPPLVRRSDLFGSLVVTTRDIKAGEEIAMDYHVLRNDPSANGFHEFLAEICREGKGLVPVNEDSQGGRD